MATRQSPVNVLAAYVGARDMANGGHNVTFAIRREDVKKIQAIEGNPNQGMLRLWISSKKPPELEPDEEAPDDVDELVRRVIRDWLATGTDDQKAKALNCLRFLKVEEKEEESDDAFKQLLRELTDVAS